MGGGKFCKRSRRPTALTSTATEQTPSVASADFSLAHCEPYAGFAALNESDSRAAADHSLECERPLQEYPVYQDRRSGGCSTFAAADVRRALARVSTATVRAAPPSPSGLAGSRRAQLGRRHARLVSTTLRRVGRGTSGLQAAHGHNGDGARQLEGQLLAAAAAAAPASSGCDNLHRQALSQTEHNLSSNSESGREEASSLSWRDREEQSIKERSARSSAAFSDGTSSESSDNNNLNSAEMISSHLQQQQATLSSAKSDRSLPTLSSPSDVCATNSLKTTSAGNNNIVHSSQAELLAMASEINVKRATLESASSTAALSAPHHKLGRLVGKKAARVKELLLQNLGRADKTTDELFEVYEENFYKQQNQAIKLAKEFKNYLSALKGCHEAGRSLNKCIQQSTIDYQSARHDLVCENLSQMEQLNEDLAEKLREQVTQRVSEYLNLFGEFKDKIAKRRRKLIDYDSSKRVYELMLAQVNKKRLKAQQQQQNLACSSNSMDDDIDQPQQRVARGLRFLSQQQQQQLQQPPQLIDPTSHLVDEARLLKLREQFNYCKIMYETINIELYEELPIVYERKMKNLLTTLQDYFSLEAHYHSNASKLLASASDVIGELPTSGLSTSLARLRRTALAQQDEEDEDKEDEVAARSDSLDKQPKELGGSGRGEAAASSEDDDRHSNEAGEEKQIGRGGTSSGIGSSRGDDSYLEDSSSGSSSAVGSPVNGSHNEAVGSSVAEVQAEANGHDGEERQVGELVDEEASGELEEQPDKIESGKGETPADAAQSVGIQQVRPSSDDVDEEKDDEEVEAKIKDEEAVAVEVFASNLQTGSDELAVADVDSKPEVVADLKEEQSSTSFATAEVADKQIVKESDEQQTSRLDVEDCQTAQEEQVTSEALYKVRTVYKYLAEDVDEICFEADEIIQVVEFDESHQPEDGWLMGVREANGQRGLFPANFTRPI